MEFVVLGRSRQTQIKPLSPLNPINNPIHPINPINNPINPLNPINNPINPINPINNPINPLNPINNPINPINNPINPILPLSPEVPWAPSCMQTWRDGAVRMAQGLKKPLFFWGAFGGFRV